ncbi:hypothetical protein HAX54_025590, partial [Datura stramonium]|nr:hypothetical protein [Datura stramonium]
SELRATDVDDNGWCLVDTLMDPFFRQCQQCNLTPGLGGSLHPGSGVPKELRDQMIECDETFNSLRVKGSPGWDRKKRKPESDEKDSDAHIELQPDLEVEKKEAVTRQAAHEMSKGMKNLLATLAPRLKLPRCPWRMPKSSPSSVGLEETVPVAQASVATRRPAKRGTRVCYGEPCLIIVGMCMFDRRDIAALPPQKRVLCSENTSTAT